MGLSASAYRINLFVNPCQSSTGHGNGKVLNLLHQDNRKEKGETVSADDSVAIIYGSQDLKWTHLDTLCSWVLCARSTYIANFPAVRRQFTAFDLWGFLFLWKLFGEIGKFGPILSAKRMHILKQLSHFRHKRDSILKSRDASTTIKILLFRRPNLIAVLRMQWRNKEHFWDGFL